ncbi:hypothetical protein KKI24_27260 [bacterium]|nr:hypothetical protein [bacterium]
MTYFEEKLPSNGHIRIKCKEYSVADAIAVSSMNPKLVERFTSKFLEVIQTGQDIVNPREMTTNDRKTLVFKYALASMEADDLQSDESYNVDDCPHCGEKHEFRLSIADFQKSAKSIIRNEPTEILTEYQGKRLKITPMLGTHAEAIERFNNAMDGIEKKHGRDSDEYQAERVKRDMYELLCQFETVNEQESRTRDSGKQGTIDKAWLHSLPQKSFLELKNLIAVKQEEIAHGIDFRHTFYCPKMQEKEGPVVVLLPFQLEDLIYRI